MHLLPKGIEAGFLISQHPLALFGVQPVRIVVVASELIVIKREPCCTQRRVDQISLSGVA
jgi:hypothetical protein